MMNKEQEDKFKLLWRELEGLDIKAREHTRLVYGDNYLSKNADGSSLAIMLGQAYNIAHENNLVVEDVLLELLEKKVYLMRLAFTF